MVREIASNKNRLSSPGVFLFTIDSLTFAGNCLLGRNPLSHSLSSRSRLKAAAGVPTNSTSSSSPRWTVSSRWEQAEGEQYILQEKYGTYFKVPNPASLFTRIICTLGPSSCDAVVISKMMNAGMTAARINMSHGSHESAAKLIDTVRQVAKQKGRLCPIILDTKGPEIRVSKIIFENDDHGSVELDSGDTVILLSGDYSQTEQRLQETAKAIAVSYPYLAKAVRVGDVVLLDDGRISLIVTRVEEHKIHAEVIEGGVLLKNKGVNLPGW